jgi:glycosyltransferase involved in cell wall biosynthesis
MHGVVPVTSLSFLIDQLLSPTPGGMGTYVRELVPALSRAEPSLEITLFHSRFEGAAPEEWTRRYPTIELRSSIRRLYPGWAIGGRPALPPSLASTDLVHSPIPAAVPPKGEGQRLVVTVHDLAFLIHPELFPPQWRLMYRAGLLRIVRSADAVIAVSRHTAEDLARRTRLPPARVHVIPLAASLPRGAADVDEVLARLKVPSPFVLFVGTLEPRKNVVRLIRAYRRVAARGAPHALVLAGPMGWRHQALMKELAVEAPGRVVLTGPTGPSDLDALYRGASVFVYPSLYEGFGLPVLEAMARGAPCVVSIASSLPEVAGEAAVPVDPRSVAGLAEAMERVINDRELAERLRAAGRVRAGSFSWDETARRTLEVYKSVR